MLLISTAKHEKYQTVSGRSLAIDLQSSVLPKTLTRPRAKSVFPLELRAKRGRRVEKATSLKSLMHSNDHTGELVHDGEAPSKEVRGCYPPFGEPLCAI